MKEVVFLKQAPPYSHGMVAQGSARENLTQFKLECTGNEYNELVVETDKQFYTYGTWYA